ncbi:T-box protein 2 [Hydra vulgaris]|uniref:T-box protein 2 n=1 Tax=Hydra vulgaris TaxID=6087 RepID=UPI0032EA7A71
MQSAEYEDVQSFRPLFESLKAMDGSFKTNIDDDLKVFSELVSPIRSPHSTLDNVQIVLQNNQLWSKFYHFGNEMILTKVGRRIFPVLGFSVYGLQLQELYSFEAEVVPADEYRYKYINNEGWKINGTAHPLPGNTSIAHPDGIQNGEHWLKNGVVFKKLKLTNKKKSKENSNEILLNSMHKYQIQLIIKRIENGENVVEKKKVLFIETTFITVTAYQNDGVTQLKIDHNPFAKAFRDVNPNAFQNIMYHPEKRQKINQDYLANLPETWLPSNIITDGLNFSQPLFYPREVNFYNNTKPILERHWQTFNETFALDHRIDQYRYNSPNVLNNCEHYDLMNSWDQRV